MGFPRRMANISFKDSHFILTAVLEAILSVDDMAGPWAVFPNFVVLARWRRRC